MKTKKNRTITGLKTTVIRADQTTKQVSGKRFWMTFFFIDQHTDQEFCEQAAGASVTAGSMSPVSSILRPVDLKVSASYVVFLEE